jgi:murein DD-endopeptidase MepM/ murein hydrolase activator NlpD
VRFSAVVAVVAMLAGSLLLATPVAGDSAPEAIGTSHIGLHYEPPAPDASEPSDELRWPLRGGITGQYGEDRGGRQHDGVDIPMPVGTPIKAAGAGRVIMLEDESGYGNYTCIAHVRITTCYAHQSRFRTKLGARVERGELIGYVGDTGSSSTPHLHFEVRRGTQPWGTPVDPLEYLPRS